MIIADTTPPSISILSPENKSYTVKDVPLTFTVNETASWIGYSLDGQANETITGNVTLTLFDGLRARILSPNPNTNNQFIKFLMTESFEVSHMVAIPKRTAYFEAPGPENTDDTLKLARERADGLGIREVIVASTRGDTGVKASEIFRGFNLVVVSHAAGWKEAGIQEMDENNRKRIRENGGKILVCSHVFAGVERAIRDRFGTAYPSEVIAQTLRLFSEGTKVAVEITAMAADAGLIAVDGDVVVIAGTSKGADTALIIKPANSKRLFDMKIKEIIAIPRETARK